MILVFGLTVWQVSLITKGQTCVEEKIEKSITNSSKQKLYDLGYKQNWRTFFEIDSISQLIIRLLIPFPFQPKHDGTKWTSKYD